MVSLVSDLNGPDWKERNHAPHPQFNRRVDEHMDTTSPVITKVRLRDVLSPRVTDTDASQVLNALAFRRRVMPFCVAALVVLFGIIWFSTPADEKTSSPAVTTSK
jgi:hypothetical protein